MKFLVYIWILIGRFMDVLITICIWVKGTQGQNMVSSQKWAFIACIYPIH